jgi:predicted homoserine dehydrogenase-like protein
VSAPLRRIGISGTGFIARQLIRALVRTSDLAAGPVLTRRPANAHADFPVPESLTSSVRQLVENCELVVECSGDPRVATEVVTEAFSHGLPVVTMNTEFHVTQGSAFVDRGYLSEAEGDQPGSIAALAEDAAQMGFDVLVYGNLKGFLNHHPSESEMAYWGQKQGISLAQVTAFTDGTKLQMEQALVANGSGATLLRRGMAGLSGPDRLEAAQELGRLATGLGRPVADYLIGSGYPPGVFLVAGTDRQEAEALRYMKMGPGPCYVLERPFHFCALEIPKTIRRAFRGEPPLLNNGRKPAINVLAVAKRDLRAGERIARGMGGFDLRGEAAMAADFPGHVPIGAVFDAMLARDVPAGESLRWDDIELPDDPACRIARMLFP